MTRRSRPLSRRTFLKGLLGTAISLPLLEAMGPAFADTGQSRARFVGLFMPNGVVFDDWFPTPAADGSLTLARNMATALAPVAEHLIIFKGVHNRANDNVDKCGHASGVQSLLTGVPMYGHFENGVRALGGTEQDAFASSGPSLDAVLYEKIAPATPVDGISVAKKVSHFSQISWLADAQRRTPEKSPTNIYTRLFGSTDPDNAAAIERMLRRRQSILDGIDSDYDVLRDQVGQADRQRIEDHLDAIRDVETRLERFVSCDTAPLPPMDVTDEDWCRVVIDMLVLAFQCDITRYSTMAFRACGGGQSYFPWLPGLIERDFDADDTTQQDQYWNNEHHEMSHRASRDEVARDKYHLIIEWFLNQFSYFVSRLAETPDGDGGTLLDNTVLLQGCENGRANGAHSHQDIPFLLAGNIDNQFRTGRFLDLSDANGGTGVAHNQLLLSVLNAFGVPDTTFGLPELCQGGPLDLS